MIRYSKYKVRCNAYMQKVESGIDEKINKRRIVQ